MQHEHKCGEVYTHQFTYVNAIKPIPTSAYKGMEDEKLVTLTRLHDLFRSCIGAIAWAVLSRADIAVYVQVLQRRGHAPRVVDIKRCNFVIRFLRRHKCGIKTIKLEHPVELTGFADAAFKALVDEPTGLALRGLAAILQKDTSCTKPTSDNKKAHLLECTVRRQKRVVRSTFSAELNGLVGSIEQLLLCSSYFTLNRLWYVTIAGGAY